jgi:hypothetical protein
MVTVRFPSKSCKIFQIYIHIYVLIPHNMYYMLTQKCYWEFLNTKLSNWSHSFLGYDAM